MHLTTLFLLFFLTLFIAFIIIPIIAYYLITAHAQSTSTLPTTGLRQIPQDYYLVTKPPAGEQNVVGGIDLTNIAGYISAALGGGGLGKLLNRKTEKQVEQTKQVVRDVSETQLQQTVVQKEALKLQYENMPNGGNNITGKEEIKLANVKKLEDQAVQNVKNS